MSVKPLKSQITKLRKKIFTNLKTRANSLEKRTVELDEYLSEQTELSAREFQIVNIESIKQKVLSSKITYIGDFHTFDQNIRNVLRILKVITKENSGCILALEMIHSEYQIYIDAYLEHHLTDLEFLESINYHSSWRFPWTHYKLIFDLAKKEGIKVIGINTEGTLHERDQFAAGIIEKTNQDNLDSKIIVLYGELHITKNKLPKLVKDLCPDIEQVIIHQNLDEVYWKLVELGQERGMVSFSSSEYCIVSAPPWIKYESMIYWYENLCDDPDFDIHEYIIENGKKIFSDDTNETFFQLSCEIVSHLQLKIPQDEIEDFNLYDHTHLEYIEEKLEGSINKDILEFYSYLIETNRSFRLPLNNTYYCSSYSMNRISYLVGIHIFHLNIQNTKISYDILNERSIENKFILFCFESMYAYFFSKIINPHRKCEMYHDLKTGFNQSASMYAVNQSVLRVMDLDNLSEDLAEKDLTYTYEVALLTGHIFGEYLYQLISVKSQNPFFSKDLLHFDVSIKSFKLVKELLLQDQDYRSHNKRYF